MTQIELQKQLDLKKWDESKLAQTDLSGKMDYCRDCKHKTESGCGTTQKNRENRRLCAKEYLKLENS